MGQALDPMRISAGRNVVTSFLRGLLVLLAPPLGCLCFFCRNAGGGLNYKKLLKFAKESSFDATRSISMLLILRPCSCLYLSNPFHTLPCTGLKADCDNSSTTKMWWCKAEPLNQRVKSLSEAWARHSTLCEFATNRFRFANHKIPRRHVLALL